MELLTKIYPSETSETTRRTIYLSIGGGNSEIKYFGKCFSIPTIEF
jgi:hypothetical protein